MQSIDYVTEYWERQSCGTGITDAQKHGRDYFEDIENYRYTIEPEIFSFAQFTRHYGEKMLEVGVGAGTDFVQWVRAGAKAHGIDLTTEGVENTRHRLEVFSLKAETVQQANAESLPFADETFDLVYSWGVIHHSPDMEQCFAEIARVAKQGGTIKLMVYNRHSIQTYLWWVRFALLKGKPWRSLSYVLHHHMESKGTKAYTRREISAMAKYHGLKILFIDTTASPFYDLLETRPWPLRVVAKMAVSLFGRTNCGWFLRVVMTKPVSPRAVST